MITGFCLKIVARGYVPGANGWNTHGFRLVTPKVWDRTHYTDEEEWRIRTPTDPTDGVPLFNLNLTSGALTRNSPDPMYDGSQVFIQGPFECSVFNKRIRTAPPAEVASRGAAAFVTVPSAVYESGSLLRWDNTANRPICGPNQPPKTFNYGEFVNRNRWGTLPNGWIFPPEIEPREGFEVMPDWYAYDWAMYFGDDCQVPGAEFV